MLNALELRSMSDGQFIEAIQFNFGYGEDDVLDSYDDFYLKVLRTNLEHIKVLRHDQSLMMKKYDWPYNFFSEDEIRLGILQYEAIIKMFQLERERFHLRLEQAQEAEEC